MEDKQLDFIIAQARKKSLEISMSDESFRNSILKDISKRLADSQQELLKCNQLDQQKAKGNLSNALYQRLCLDETKTKQLQLYPQEICNLKDPIKQLQLACKLDKGLVLKRYAVPIGVLLVIFESRPEVLIQISSLAIKSGNAVIVKGGREAQETNLKLFEIVQKSLQKFKMGGLINLLQSRLEIKKLIQKEGIDLIIPRGSNSLVREIQEDAKSPVLGHTEGICHVYIDEAADAKKVIPIVLDSKTQYPAACNALETLLIHKNCQQDLIIKLFKQLQTKGVELRLDDTLAKLADNQDIVYQTAKVADWQTEYTDLILAVKQVKSVTAAIEHINYYGSHHTDSIVTEKQKTADLFLWLVDSAGVYHNVSTRFSDGMVYGFGAEVGVSTNKFHSRGPVGLEGLMTYKYFLTGSGNIIADYSGKNGRKFLHKALDEN